MAKSKRPNRFNLTQVKGKPNTWKIRVYAGQNADGKARYRTKEFKADGKQAARDQADVLGGQMKGGVRHRQQTVTTVTELVDTWVSGRAQRTAPATIYRETSIVTAIKAGLGPIRLDDLTARHIDAWYDVLRRQEGTTPGHKGRLRSESTIHHYHRVLAAILNQGVKWELLDRSPITNAAKPKRKRGRPPKLPSHDEMRTMIEVAPDAFRVGLRIAAATGLRRGELAGLRFADIDGGMLTVERAVSEVPRQPLSVKPLKVDVPRQLRLGAGTLALLADWRTKCEETAGTLGTKLAADAFILCDFTQSPAGQWPRKPSWLGKAWDYHCKQAGLAHFKFHAIRSYHATTLRDGLVPISAISNRLGHQRNSTTDDIYTDRTTAGDDLGSAVIEAILDAV